MEEIGVVVVFHSTPKSQCDKGVVCNVSHCIVECACAFELWRRWRCECVCMRPTLASQARHVMLVHVHINAVWEGDVIR